MPELMNNHYGHYQSKNNQKYKKYTDGRRIFHCILLFTFYHKEGSLERREMVVDRSGTALNTILHMFRTRLKQFHPNLLHTCLPGCSGQ